MIRKYHNHKSQTTHLANTCDKPRSSVKTSWAVDLLQPALTATSRTVFRRSLSMTFITARICFLPLHDGHLRWELSVHPLLNLPCNLYTSCLETFLYLSVICVCFNVCMGVIPPSTHKFISVLRVVASSKVVIFFNFQKEVVHYTLPHSYTNNVIRSKLDILTSDTIVLCLNIFLNWSPTYSFKSIN